MVSKKAVISLRGKEVNRINLNKKVQRFRVNGCLIEIAEGKVRVASSTCPNKICVSTGWINKPSQVIVCAPQRVVVKIEGSSQASQVDAVSK